jgi:hypothetical protein
MMEYYFMILLCASLWIFIVAPVGICIIFDINHISYKDSVKASLWLSLAVILLIIFVFAISACINFLSGDPEPISTLINRLQSHQSIRQG